jgi:hypothetical protein
MDAAVEKQFPDLAEGALTVIRTRNLALLHTRRPNF